MTTPTKTPLKLVPEEPSRGKKKKEFPTYYLNSTGIRHKVDIYVMLTRKAERADYDKKRDAAEIIREIRDELCR